VLKMEHWGMWRSKYNDRPSNSDKKCHKMKEHKHASWATDAKACGDFLGIRRRHSAHVVQLDAHADREIRPSCLVLISVKICTSALEPAVYVCHAYFDVVGHSFDEPVDDWARDKESGRSAHHCVQPLLLRPESRTSFEGNEENAGDMKQC
jgi:hypothetical protein